MTCPVRLSTQDRFWTGLVVMFYCRQSFFANRCRAVIAFVCAALALATAASAQSSRPGWGATPYHDAQGTGVTFRVWAPNATTAYVPGTFNNWSTTATRLVQEQTNGAVDGIWSADVAGVTNHSQYKYYFNGNLW